MCQNSIAGNLKPEILSLVYNFQGSLSRVRAVSNSTPSGVSILHFGVLQITRCYLPIASITAALSVALLDFAR